jgi:DNA invertase Pin-like site-specific DNA recombinase
MMLSRLVRVRVRIERKRITGPERLAWPPGGLVLNIMAAVSQWEPEAIGERTRDVLRHKRSQGERVDNIAFGFRLSGDRQHVEPDRAEQAALAEIRQLRSQGTPLRGIANRPTTQYLYASDAFPAGYTN